MQSEGFFHKCRFHPVTATIPFLLLNCLKLLPFITMIKVKTLRWSLRHHVLSYHSMLSYEGSSFPTTKMTLADLKNKEIH